MDSNKKLTIDISTAAILKVVLIFIAMWFVYVIRDILIILFVSIILSSALSPIVKYLQDRKFPRVLAIVLIYACLLLVLASAIFLLVPPFTEQMGQLVQSFPVYWEKILSGFYDIKEYSEEHGFFDNIQNALNSLQTTLSHAAGNIFSLISTIFGSIVSFILIFVLTFYFLVQEHAVKKTFKFITPKKYWPYVSDLITRMQNRVGAWMRGELVLALIIGSLSFIGFWLLGIRYFLILAVIAGLFELIPYIGPILAAIPAIFLAFTQSPLKALFVLILCWLIQQIENNLVVPKVMQKAVGLNPIVVIISILIGAKLAGFLGIVLAVPTVAALSVPLKDFFDDDVNPGAEAK